MLKLIERSLSTGSFLSQVLFCGCSRETRHDKTSGVAARRVGGGGSLGFGLLRPAGPEPASDLQRGGLADAAVPAGVIRLLLAGHGGLPAGHLQRLRRGGQGAAGADPGGQSGLEEKGLKDVEEGEGLCRNFGETKCFTHNHLSARK